MEIWTQERRCNKRLCSCGGSTQEEHLTWKESQTRHPGEVWGRKCIGDGHEGPGHATFQNRGKIMPLNRISRYIFCVENKVHFLKWQGVNMKEYTGPECEICVLCLKGICHCSFGKGKIWCPCQFSEIPHMLGFQKYPTCVEDAWVREPQTVQFR